jgi:PAS domain S-box-containing protein
VTHTAPEEANEREQDRQELDRERSFVSAVLDTAGALVIVLDREGRIVRYNRFCEATTGYTAAEVTGRRFWDFLVPPDESSRVRAMFECLRAGHLPDTSEYHWVRKDGVRRLISWSNSTLANGDGRVEHVIAVGVDVTERHRAEQALRQSREQYRLFIEQTTEGVWLAAVEPPLPIHLPIEQQVRHCLAHARMIECNEAMLRQYGCRDRAELVGTRLSDTFDPDDAGTFEFIRAFIHSRYRTSELESLEFDRQGVRHWFSNNMVGVVEDGHLTRIWGSQQDVTERKLAEEAVRDTRDHLRALVQASPLAVIELLPGGEVTSWNRAAETIFGWTAGEALGRRLLCVPAAKQSEFDALRARVLAGQAFTNYETQRQRKDGSLIEVSISTAALHDADGSAIGLVALYADVTERKRAAEALRDSQEQLRQAQKMEAVGRLAGGIAHDFNNLLTAILSYSEMTLDDLAPDDPIRDDVEQIRQAGGRAADLVNQLLAFSRRQLLQLRTLDLNSVVLGVDRMLRRLIGEDIELRAELAPDLAFTRADAGQMEQVLLNLAVNARDAMPAGGTLTITTANADIGEAAAVRWANLDPGSYVAVSVRDSGSGMTPEVRERIFEPFFTTKGPAQGTGLGLSTVYGIVKQSGGSIFVASEPGAGSTFTIYLPATEPVPGAAHDLRPARPVRGSAETILLVEDEELVRQLTREILIRNGYRVLEAADGAEAVRICEQYHGAIDLMLTDVVMPRLSGPDTVERVRPGRPDMRVLYVSGYSEDAIERQGQLTAGIELLPKPFTPGVLTAKIREILDRTL